MLVTQHISNIFILYYDLGRIWFIIRGQFQNQPPIGWSKKYKIEKILLYGTVT